MSGKRVKYDTSPKAANAAAKAEESSVYERGQTVIPKNIREALSIEYGTRLHWEVREGVIHVLPIPQQPVRALRGALKGTGVTFQAFMQERQQERQLERRRELRVAEERAEWDTSSTPQP
jgi:AbrB family looped-hinge helix DNA binding protein